MEKSKTKHVAPAITALAYTLLVPFLFACSSQRAAIKQEVAVDPTHKVVVIVLDGARYSETFGDSTRQHIPYLSALASQGTLFTSFYNDGLTQTMAGHSTLLTGHYDVVDNGGYDSLQRPGIMQLYQRQTGAPATATVMLATKGKLRSFAGCGSEVQVEEHALALCGESIDHDVMLVQKTESILSTHAPSVSYISFSQPDYAGHDGIWEGYIDALKLSDSLAVALYHRLRRQPAYQDALFVFTNDHGRHLGERWADHGDDCAGCRHIMLLAIGGGMPADVIVQERFSMAQLMPTLSKYLGLSLAVGYQPLITHFPSATLPSQ